MELTKRQEKQLKKVFDDPKKLRKWIDEVFREVKAMSLEQAEQQALKAFQIYQIAVAYTLHYVCGFGKKRLPNIIERIWNNIDSLYTGHLSIEDCIEELKECGIEYNSIINTKSKINWEGNNDNIKE